MPKPIGPSHIIRLSDAKSSGHDFEIQPEKQELADIAGTLDLVDLRKVRFVGKLRPDGARDWRLDATLGATVVQPCRVTLAPVTTRIDEPVTRRYVADVDEVEVGEAEMPDDDSVEALPVSLDLNIVMREALALALPAFPRADDAALETSVFSEPGTKPMSDDDAKPFAGLAKLKNKLGDAEN
jgi:uncharacterized metal-binding protein YceD (DUF177 family)